MSSEPNSLRLSESRIANIQGIFAADLAELMIREGILGAPLHKMSGCYGYFTKNSSYAWSRPYPNRFTDLACWIPSFLSPEVWSSAVHRFSRFSTLVACLTRDLLPILDDPDSLFHYLYYDRPLVSRFLDRQILETPIRTTRESLFLFDTNGIYQRLPRPQAIKPEELLPWHNCYCSDINCFAWVSAVHLFRPGMTLEECVKLFLGIRTPSGTHSAYTSLERLVQSVSRPTFERDPENKDTHTFDRIRLEVNLAAYLYPSFSELSVVVRRMKPTIDKIVLRHLEQNIKFQKFGVPVNFLRVSECFLRRDRVLDYIFEFKPVISPPL